MVRITDQLYSLSSVSGVERVGIAETHPLRVGSPHHRNGVGVIVGKLNSVTITPVYFHDEVSCIALKQKVDDSSGVQMTGKCFRTRKGTKDEAGNPTTESN